jgi:NAD-reducing hydrogenase small subunit
MSLLDMDEFLIDLGEKVELVYSPIADAKEFPEHVDVTLAEGAIANYDNLELIHTIRARTKVLVSLGDCAVTGNVTALRNPLGGPEQVLEAVYLRVDPVGGRIPDEAGIVPRLLDRVMPVHAVVPVDAYLPGCPPPAPRIRAVLEQLLAGAELRLSGRDMMKFG